VKVRGREKGIEKKEGREEEYEKEGETK